MKYPSLKCNHTQDFFPYEITVGFDFNIFSRMLQEWDRQKSATLIDLRKAYQGKDLSSPDVIAEAISEFNLGDVGWDWTRKSLHCMSNDYIWFFLSAADEVQSVCVVYHPKASRLDGQPIFYIDYIASAFFNRSTPARKKRFSGVGTTLMACVSEYAKRTLGYRAGFCLHSVPSAEAFYTSLGMTDFGIDTEKEDLKYFEADEAVAVEIAGRAYV